MRRTGHAPCLLFLLAFLAMSPTVSYAQTYTESILYAPSSVSDGINIFAPLIQASDGNFYGVAFSPR